VKSAIAREVIKRRARERGAVPVEVTSRGVRPEDHVSPGLRAKLRSDGIDPGAEPAQALSPVDVGRAQVIIAFDEAAQDSRLRGARVWTTPSWNDDYVAAKAALAPQVEALLDELSARGCAVAGQAG
jgi:protein-tyrosine-phosphatase